MLTECLYCRCFFVIKDTKIQVGFLFSFQLFFLWKVFQSFNNRQHIWLQDALIVLRLYSAQIQDTLWLMQQSSPDRNRASSVFHCRYRVLFFVCFILWLCEHIYTFDAFCQVLVSIFYFSGVFFGHLSLSLLLLKQQLSRSDCDVPWPHQVSSWSHTQGGWPQSCGP